jgi:endonuclease/exonuclease/phosphatase family metal-dependent hydrolase
MDGKVSTSRIARVIAQYDPDVVALQESYGEVKGGQVEAIAKELRETYQYPADMVIEQDNYGNAILSMHPMKLIKAGDLPTLLGQAKEIRGAIWVQVEVLGIRINLLNTHLGLFSLERQRQVEALLSDQWLNGLPENNPHLIQAPTLLVGDFNAVPSSAVFRTLTEKFYCAQESAQGHKSRNTFPGRYPVSRIDHVFCSREFKILKVQVPRTHLARLASDHLPLLVELSLAPDVIVETLAGIPIQPTL